MKANILSIKKQIFFLFVFLVLLVTSGCSPHASQIPMNQRWTNIEGSQLNSEIAGEQFYFNIQVDEGMVAEAEPLSIKVSGTVQAGTIHFELRDPRGKSVWKSDEFGSGPFSAQINYDLDKAETGTYSLGLVYSAGVSAIYNLSWEAIRLNTLVLLPGIGMILVAFAFVLLARRYKISNKRYLLFGGLFWVLTVAVKFIVAIPLNPIILNALKVSPQTLFAPGNLLAYLYIGSLTGIFEAGLAWLILSKVNLGKADRNQALIFGIGFGTIEALLLGLSAAFSASAALLAPQLMPIPTLGALAGNMVFLTSFAPIVERVFVILAHIFACMLIFYAINTGKAKWGLLSIVYKTLLDAPAGFAAYWGTNSLGKLWTIEGTIIVMGLIGLWGTIELYKRYSANQIKTAGLE